MDLRITGIIYCSRWGFISLGSSLLEFQGPGFDFHSSHTFSMYFAHSSFLLHLIFHLKHKGKLNVWCRKNNKYNMYIIYQKLIQPFSVCLSVCLSPPSRNFSFQPTVTMFKCFSIVDLINSIIISYQMKCPLCF